MTYNSEIHIRAGHVADAATDMLKTDGISDAAVVVTQGAWTRYPLAIRTPSGDGFGAGTVAYYHEHKKLMQEAVLQAEYQLRTGGRTAAQQQEKLAKVGRTAASYGTIFPNEMIANYAYDQKSGLTVVTVAKDVDATVTTKISEKAIENIDKGSTPTASPASTLIAMSLMTMLHELPNHRTGFAMITSPIYERNRFNDSDTDPLVICSQSAGSVVEPANYAIVAAKAKSVTIVGKASGPKSTYLSQIEGAVPIRLKNGSERIFATGGLPDGAADVRVVQATLETMYSIFGISIINKLAINPQK